MTNARRADMCNLDIITLRALCIAGRGRESVRESECVCVCVLVEGGLFVFFQHVGFGRRRRCRRLSPYHRRCQSTL